MSFKADLVLNLVHSRIDHDESLLDFQFLLVQLPHLLFQESDLVHVHVLQFSEIFFNIKDVFKNLLESVIGLLDRMVFEGGQFRA